MADRLPELASLPTGLVLDGDLVAFALDGRPSFPLLCVRVLHGREAIPVTFMVFDARTGGPLAWRIEAAKATELSCLEPLLDALDARGFRPETVIGDTGYDYMPGHETVMEHGAVPVFARRRFAGKDDWTEAPECEHGRWTFAGANFKRRAAQWRCPTGECSPKSRWIKASRRNPLLPRGTRRFGKLYAGRGAVERGFGRLKNEYGLTPLRTRGRERVALHADLVMLARLSQALARARAVPLAA